MNFANKPFPAKILLFGEYGILYGTHALAIPYNNFKGQIEIKEGQNNEVFYPWLKYLIFNRLDKYIDLKQFEADIEKGLQYLSNIPESAGLGSSGALVAATYSRYALAGKQPPPEKLKTIFSAMESYFHGKSSGIDPLVSFLGKPVVTYGRRLALLKKEILHIKCAPFNWFLIDSGAIGDTGPLVQQFQDKLNKLNNKDYFIEAYQKHSNNAIYNLTTGEYIGFWKNFKSLSQFQLSFMSELIPHTVRGVFQQGIETNDFYMKILGSGGGGYFLGLAKGTKLPIGAKVVKL